MSAPKETVVQEREPPSTVITRMMKEGWVKKRSGRMHQWTNRYFILHDSSLSYKLKQDATTIRGTFNLVPGSVVTDIIEESIVKMKSNKLYSFWIVNPGASKPDKDDEKMYDSDEENEPGDNKDATNSPNATATSASTSPAPVNRNLQHIVRNEVNTQKRQKELAEEQVELHQAHDNTVSQGAYVAAAVAVGGVVVGAMTFGIGLIPYFAVVGITAAASGGVVAFNSRRRPENSRLIMAFESNKEAIEWKAAIEQQIRLVSESRRPMLPDSVDAQTISAILDLNSSTGSVWKRVAVYEGVCVLEHITFEKRSNSHYKYHPMMNFQDQSAFYTFWLRLIMDPEYMKVCIAQQNMLTIGDKSNTCGGGGRSNNNRVRKAQLSVCNSPGDTFLALMNTEAWCWPSKGTFKVVREIDDHADIIGVEIVTDCTKYGGKSAKLRRRMCLSRFWQLDDDGVYLVTYSSVKDEGFTPSLTMDDFSKQESGMTTTEENNCNVQFDAVVTIAPRHDVANIDSDIPEAMVTCICQVNLQKGNWQKGEVTALMESFLKDNLLELRQTLWNNKYCISRDGTSSFGGGFAASEAPSGHIGALDRGESNEFYMSGGEGKLGSPTTKASKTVTSPPVLSPASTAEKKVLSGTRGYGVTTVQPGVEDEGGKTPHHLTCDDSVVAAAPPKKRLGFLARMKSSSAVPSSKPPPPAPGAGITTSPNGSLRKEMTLNVSTSASAQNRSVSPLGALLSRGKTTTAIQPAATAAVQGNRSRNSSSDANFDSDDYSDSPGPPGKHGDQSPSNSPPSSPVQNYKKSETRVASPLTKRPRDKKTNAEASKLRNVICMTDYEITRLTKSLKKRMGALQTLEAQHHGHSATEEAMHQHTVLEYNAEIQSLHTQIGRLTVRQQGLKDEYLELTGEVFEPSKGTRGMMERWKGARLAAKEIKEMKDKEKGDKHAGTSNTTSGAKIDPFNPQSTLPTTTATLSAVSGGSGNPAFQLKRSNSGDYYAVNKRTSEDKPQTLRPSHWEPISPILVRSDPAARSLIGWFGQMLSFTLESDSVTSSSLRVSKSLAQRSAADAAMKDVRAANLMLVLLFTASFVMATLVASCFAA